MTSRNQASSDSHNSSEVTTKAIATTVTSDSRKVHTEGGWTKRSARTRERLQPIGADATHIVPHDSNNNLRAPENGTEAKNSVPQLTKRITSGVGKEKPGTSNKVKDVEEENAEEVTVNEGGQFLPPIK